MSPRGLGQRQIELRLRKTNSRNPHEFRNERITGSMTFDGAVIGLIVRYEERVASMRGRIALPANHTIDGSLVCRTQLMGTGAFSVCSGLEADRSRRRGADFQSAPRDCMTARLAYAASSPSHLRRQ